MDISREDEEIYGHVKVRRSSCPRSLNQPIVEILGLSDLMGVAIQSISDDFEPFSIISIEPNASLGDWFQQISLIPIIKRPFDNHGEDVEMTQN